MRVFLALILGALVGAGALWYYNTRNPASPADSTTSLTNQLQGVMKSASNALESAGNAVEEKLRQWHLEPQTIKEEMARTGQVVRKKAEQAGRAIADATADARTTAAIKGKLLAKTDFSSLGISVNTTDGVVTLSGSAPSADYIGKAVMLAMETEGVREVISTVQVQAKAGQDQK